MDRSASQAVRGQLTYAKVVDDEQRDSLARAIQRSLRELFAQDVGFTVDHFVPLQNRGLPVGLAR